MKSIYRRLRSAAVLVACTSQLLGRPAAAQNSEVPPPSRDTVLVQASSRYEAGALHRWFLGDAHRDAWSVRARVPVLDLARVAGGLKASETGGSAQTRSLRFLGADGHVYVFRPIVKDVTHEAMEPYENTIIEDVVEDGLSSSHPMAVLIAAPIQKAAGILHPEPTLYVMPNDPRLGEFRQEFAGKLGTLEEHLTMPEEGPGIGGALDIIDSDDLLEHLNETPKTRVDTRALLTARLVDILINDNDRHPDQWKWAKLEPGDDAPWVPIARDRDKALVRHDGFGLVLARKAKPNLVDFAAEYPDLRAFLGKTVNFDQRLLIGLEEPVWDSVANWLRSVITDSVIDAAIHNTPRAYWPISAGIRERLRARRDRLPNVAARFYRILAELPEIHGTDAAERARVTREGDGLLVELQSEDGARWFQRRFKAGETREVRLYLHGGDDSAVVTGNGTSDILVRVVGGMGTNSIVDSSTVNGRRRLTRIYERGHVAEDEVEYGSDSVFNRRPWVRAFGTFVPPLKDRGGGGQFGFKFRSGSGLGPVAGIGYTRTTYGFRYFPYKEKMGFELEYAAQENALRLTLDGERRIESSRWHFLGRAGVSQLEMLEFRGFGNTVPDSDDPFFDLRQRQFWIRPAVGFSFAPESDISLGPIVKYVQTDSIEDNFISEESFTGFPRFAQAGVQLLLEHDTRDSLSTSGFVFELDASYYAPVLDAPESFASVGAVARTYFTFPLLTRPTLALRGGAKRVFGEAPYYEAAMVGGRRTLRTQHRDRFAGDAALYGTVELRFPLPPFNLWLPWNFGLLGLMEAGRVYHDGESPGTWHSARGYGGWIGLLSQKYSIQILRTNRPERRLIIGTGLAF